METREPVLLVVLVEAERLRWFVAAIGMDGSLSALLRSEEGDLATCQGLDFDNQLSFLRHRFCGVLQRGADRLWPVNRKPCQFVFVLTGVLPGTTAELNQRLAENLTDWFSNPPVIFLTGSEARTLKLLTGSMAEQQTQAFQAGVEQLFTAIASPQGWELSQRKATWQPS